jgi:hypothetical protein
VIADQGNMTAIEDAVPELNVEDTRRSIKLQLSLKLEKDLLKHKYTAPGNGIQRSRVSSQIDAEVLKRQRLARSILNLPVIQLFISIVQLEAEATRLIALQDFDHHLDLACADQLRAI